MLIKRNRGWEIPEARVTPEHVFLNRRNFMAAGAGAMALAAVRPAHAAEDPSASLYPAKLNPNYSDPGRPVTGAEYTTTFNNYYEFGSSKRVADSPMGDRDRRRS
jgi:sulfoxide reductase catalytic subunit YedY